LGEDYRRRGIMIRMGGVGAAEAAAGEESSEDEAELPLLPDFANEVDNDVDQGGAGMQIFRQLHPRRRLPEVPNMRQQLQQHLQQQQQQQQQQQRLPIIDQILGQEWAQERLAEARRDGRQVDHMELLHEQAERDLDALEPRNLGDHLMMNNRMHPYHFRPRPPIHPIAIDWMNLNYLGFPESVAISELPGSNFRQRRRDFAADLRTIKSKDITDVVCLLTEPEFSRYRVPNLLEDYRSAGLVVYHYAIEDGKIPTNLYSLAQLLAKIKKRMADGNRILIHCFGGMGRAVLIGCCLVMDLDDDVAPSEVIEQVRALRGPRAVQSVKQYNFINEYRDLRQEALHMAYCYSDSDEERCVSR